VLHVALPWDREWDRPQSKGDIRRTASPARPLSRSHYRYPRVSDRKLDVVSFGATAAVAVLSLVFVPSPWRYPLIVLELIVLAVMGIQIRRRYRAVPSFFYTNHQEARAREALIKQHFTTFPQTYTVACNYCDWKTTDYAHRLLRARATHAAQRPPHLRLADVRSGPVS
jgi:hypothetical protein